MKAYRWASVRGGKTGSDLDRSCFGARGNAASYGHLTNTPPDRYRDAPDSVHPKVCGATFHRARDTGTANEEFLRQLAKESGIETPAREQLVKLDRKRPRKGSIEDCVNPHDPDAQITKIKDGRTDLRPSTQWILKPGRCWLSRCNPPQRAIPARFHDMSDLYWEGVSLPSRVLLPGFGQPSPGVRTRPGARLFDTRRAGNAALSAPASRL